MVRPRPADADPEPRHVIWRDLVTMRPSDGLIECLHPLPWLALSFLLAGAGLWLLAAPATFMFFLTALRLNHEAIHHNLGFGPRGHRRVLHALSALMLGSNSSVAFNHLLHHQKIGTEDDIEGRCGNMRLLEVLRFGPRFPVETHLYGWKQGGPQLRRRMAIDLALNLMVIGAAIACQWVPLLYHIAAMLVAQSLTAFFAVWITHHGCEEGLVARTQRGRLFNLVSYNMFFHLEHHLFPAVPVSRLPTLAARIDAAAPKLAKRLRMVVPVLQRSIPSGEVR
ncbi:fatty acid desaturase [Sphingomonas koreensis]|uniref:fatty acid desaturase n=1 Tax=Sphingomonas koreensis TaxID=93064 RepID=UPI000F7DC155|nr:fatty acid desaturase [Sphingomonas koreensis]RSX35353.1 fatty acid desaturase [Sphingomonas koreensis]